MIKIENAEVLGWEHAIRGMRNSHNSWSMSDSEWLDRHYLVGEKDLRLMKRLSNAGTDHAKFMRMITVYCDIVAPLYWWKEFDTYKVGTVANSCSTMHKIHDNEFTTDDFSRGHLFNYATVMHFRDTITLLNTLRMRFLDTRNKDYWYAMIQLLPSSYNQRRTVMLNYQVLKNMYHARKNHKLDEWRGFCNWISTLPFAKELIIGENEEEKEE